MKTVILDDAAAESKARETEASMTDDERFSLLYSLMIRIFGSGTRESRVPADLPAVAGYVPGVERLGIPPLVLADASLGLRHTGGPEDSATAFPAGLALGSTFNPALARRIGELIGQEARARGFNVALGGGINLVREVRNGRNFEYLSEDPWLTALMGAETVSGIQSQHVIALLKHLSLNASETDKFFLNAVIDPAAHRESDLLAFEIAIERSRPGAVMGAYNMINGSYASGNDAILNGVLKNAWEYKGWVMSDWKAVYSWDYILKGLDQQSGAQLDDEEWFSEPLKQAVADGRVPKERIADSVRRMLRSYYAVGIDNPPRAAAADMNAGNAMALEAARQGAVLLKNTGLLPLARDKSRIALIGGYGNAGVLSGDGSSQVMPPGGYAATIPMHSHPLLGPTTMRFFPGSPLEALRRSLPEASIEYDPGALIAEAVALARRSDVVVINAIRHEGERFDSADMSLPFGQDALIEAIAAVHSKVVVVLQTGNPVSMPWLNGVDAVLQAWYPGQAGAQAIADIVTGRANPSGRLPITFPVDVAQTPHPVLPGADVPLGTPINVEYDADVGYRWFARTGAKPLYAFGHGLSYTRFDYADFRLKGGETVTATFTVTNAGQQAGADVPQLYLTSRSGQKVLRLLGFERIELSPGESRTVTIEADPRLLAHYDSNAGSWRILEGDHRVALARSAEDHVVLATAHVPGRTFGR